MAKPTNSNEVNPFDNVRTNAENVGRSYPTLIWLNGRPGFPGWRAFGAFFIPYDEISPGHIDTSVFTRGEFVTDNDESIDGYYAHNIRIAVITYRRAWEVNINGRDQRYCYADFERAAADGLRYNAKPRGKCQIVCDVNGISEYVSLTLSGMAVAGFIGRGGWANTMRKRLISPAERVYGVTNRLPSLCFNVVIGGKVNGDGKPVYTQVGSGNQTSRITEIDLIAPTTNLDAKSDIATFIVPKDVREKHEEEYEACADWRKSWDVTQALDNRQRDTYPRRDDTSKPAQTQFTPMPNDGDDDEIPF